MEIARAGGTSARALPGKVLRAIFSNALVLGIAAGFVVNLAGIALPAVLTDAVDLLVRAGIPAALFGLGGVLHRYRPEGDMRVILFICAVSLVLHPAITSGWAGHWVCPRTHCARPWSPGHGPGRERLPLCQSLRGGPARRRLGRADRHGLTVLTATVWLSILP